MATALIYNHQRDSYISSSSLCTKCGRIGTKCHCFRGLLPALGHAFNITGAPLTSILDDDDLLDIGNEEASLDLDIAAPTCEKSEQHNEFIDVFELDLSKLPMPIRHPSLLVWLRNCIPLVVRLNNSKHATGRVVLFPHKIGQSTICTNTDCPHRHLRGPEHNIYSGLAIITNKHVVKSNEEAKKTRIEFFYHDYDDRLTVVKEMGLELNSTNRAMDHTVFTCTAHDKDLIGMIILLLDIVSMAWLKIPKKIRIKSKDYAIVISHPHGIAKRISIGNKIKTKIRDNSGEARENVMLLRSIYNLCEKHNGLLRFAEYYRIVKDLPLSYSVTYYTAATCQGSSGAPVYMGDIVLDERGNESNPPHTHRGKDPDDGYNVCFT